VIGDILIGFRGLRIGDRGYSQPEFFQERILGIIPVGWGSGRAG